MRKNVGGYERIARLALGGVLLYLAMSRWRGRARGKAAMAAGTNLISTGATQKCPANAAMGRDTYRRTGESGGALSDLPA